ncbi:hypothetical protein [Limnobacter sp.]|uniref:hypothetical protein n=1 Tax=Limnobacter sp. TaxID=2003368 RepID=UPI0025BCAB9F|nr:hypothetical protein [Limnobacter sp.]
MTEYESAFRYRLHQEMDYVFETGVTIDTTLTDATLHQFIRYVIHAVPAGVNDAGADLGSTHLCNVMLQLSPANEPDTTTLHYDNICPTVAVRLIGAHARAILSKNHHKQV